MDKFSQITFDFFAPADQPAKPVERAAEPEQEVEKVKIIEEKEPEIIDFNHISFVAEEPAPVQEPSVKSSRGRKSLKSFETEFPDIPEDESQFEKQYYSIGEVALMFKVNASLLRFWESEFDIIQPRKNKKGDRHFRPVDIKNIELIYDLLRRRKLTIEGAKEYLKSNKRGKEKFEMIRKLEEIKSFFLEMKANL
jgi:DNA-binding transcriptional MerR regulator